MSDPRSELARDAAILEAALREDWPRQDPRLHEVLRRRPEWVDLLEGPPAALSTAGALDGPDRRLTDELLALARQRQERRAPLRAIRRPSPWMLAAAGLVLCLGGLTWWSRLGTSTDEPVQSLGGSDLGSTATPAVACVAQDPAGSDPWTLQWKLAAPLSADQSIEILVRSCSGEAGSGRELARRILRPSLLPTNETSASWTLTPEVRAQAQDCFEWVVTLLDANGLASASDSARVELSDR